VLADVLNRDGQQLSATQTRNQALADADHLAFLYAIWTAETAHAREQRYQDLLLNALPPGHRAEPSHQARWLWRTLRAAELAGLDVTQILTTAIGERDLAGARDIASGIDARLRNRFGSVIPLPFGPWSDQIPEIADSGRRAYAGQIAAMMDARKDRIGQHIAGHSPAWAVTALGPVPDHPVDRLDWQRRASSIGAWRELSASPHVSPPAGPASAGPRSASAAGTATSRSPSPATARRRPSCGCAGRDHPTNGPSASIRPRPRPTAKTSFPGHTARSPARPSRESMRPSNSTQARRPDSNHADSQTSKLRKSSRKGPASKQEMNMRLVLRLCAPDEVPQQLREKFQVVVRLADGSGTG
jgi:hypothetical protein